MIQLINMKAKNFLSFEGIDYDFKSGKTTLIQGNNLTDDGQESNGSGKSAIQSCLSFCLDGDGIRKVVDNKLIRRGETTSKLLLTLYNTFNKEYFIINRTISLKGSSTLEIYKSKDKDEVLESDKVSFVTVLDGNKLIIDYIGISKSDLDNYFIPNELNYKSFFKSSDKDKKDIISRFTKADIIDGVENVVELDCTMKKNEIRKQEDLIVGNNATITVYENQILKEQLRDIEKEKEQFIVDIEKSVSNVNTSILELEKRIEEDTKEIDTLTKDNKQYNDSLLLVKKQLSEIKPTDNILLKIEGCDKIISSNNKKIKTLRETEEQYRELKVGNNEDIQEMNLVLKGVIVCPNCSHEFVLDTKTTIKEAKQIIRECEESLATINEDLLTISTSILKTNNLKTKTAEEKDEFEKEIQLISEAKRKLEKSQREQEKLLLDNVQEIDNLKSSIGSIKTQIKTKQISIVEIEKQKKSVDNIKLNNTLIKESNTNIQLLKEKNEDIEKVINNLKLELGEIESWKTKFKMFKSYLANKKLRVIQSLINDILRVMKADYSIKIEGFKMLANKEIREKITPYIIKDGEVCDFGEFSKGERSRIDFATMLALQKLINQTSISGGFDLLFVDEILEGIDGVGITNLLKSFELTGVTSLITTHITTNNLHDNILLVEKINGTSKIK